MGRLALILALSLLAGVGHAVALYLQAPVAVATPAPPALATEGAEQEPWKP